MSLAAGTRLGPYEVLALIGAGGMGEVYKGYDTRLDRTVAIKVLPAHISTDPGRRTRFEREAKTIAALTHPSICTLHDVGEHDGSMFLVMEHLDGETLAERLVRGPLPIDESLSIAIAIASALSAAHLQGIVHRDLKPGNVMLTKAGAKLLDFGLAKLTGRDEGRGAAPFASVPTRTSPLTAEGVIVGTLQYMAPEQLEGKPADARADLWALGAMLYEMVTGRRAFEGTSAASLIASIVQLDPPSITTLRPPVPRALDRIVRRCLVKDRDERWQDAHDLLEELRWIRDSAGSGDAGNPPSVGRRVVGRRSVAALAVVVAAIAGAGGWFLLSQTTQRAVGAHVSVDVLPGDELYGGGLPTSYDPTPAGARTAFTWTPDGRSLVLAGRRGGIQQLFVRPLDRDDAQALVGTEGAQVPTLSPDGRWIAFWAGQAIKKVPIEGGPVADITDGIPFPPTGMVWAPSGRIYYGANLDRIWAIEPDGRNRPVTILQEGELCHVVPALLPSERALLFTVRKTQWTWGSEDLVAFDPGSGERVTLLHDAADGRYIPTGHLVFMRRGTMFAVRFDPSQLRVVGQPVALMEGVAQSLLSGDEGNVTGAGQFAVGPTGTLAWVRASVPELRQMRVVVVGRQGTNSSAPLPTRPYAMIRLSPDLRRAVLPLQTITESGLWMGDLTRGALARLVSEGHADWPLWSRDGKRIAFQWQNGGRFSVAVRDAEGLEAPRVIVTGNFVPSSWSADGTQLLVTSVDGGISRVTLDDRGNADVHPLPGFGRQDRSPELSPDERWLAYGSSASGVAEVYVQPYPGPGPKLQVSMAGGVGPAWGRGGRELYFVGPRKAAGQRPVMAASFQPSPAPQVGTPRTLFEIDASMTFGCTPVRCYDVSPDGERFYALESPKAPSFPRVASINLIQNWFEELEARVPPGK